jgi:polyisoprenyl-phosphate glycosyltransferase
MTLTSIVIPCFNESGNIRPLYDEICRVCGGMDLEFVFVNDGSTDATAQNVCALQAADPRVRLVSLITNAGHQSALRAGIAQARGERVVMLDGDMQHPPARIPDMMKKADDGFDCVCMVHSGHQKGLLKNFFSRHFYRLFILATGVDIKPGASDFRLISRRVANVLNALPERRLFLRGLLPVLGFSTCYMDYDVQPRRWGNPGYTFTKSFRMALDALFNFTHFPITLFFYLGIIVACSSFGFGITNVVLRFFTGWSVPGVTDVIALVLFLNGLILIMLALLGKYLQVVLDHLKGRPEFLIDIATSNLQDTQPAKQQKRNIF